MRAVVWVSAALLIPGLSGCGPAARSAGPSPAPQAASVASRPEAPTTATLEHLIRAHRRFPDDPDLAMRLAKEMARLGREEEALTLFRRAGRVRPDLIPAFVGEGQMWLRLGRPASAVRAFERAIRLAPNEPLLLLELTAAYLDLRDFPAALRHAEQARRLAPDNPEVYRALATVYSATGNISATKQAGQKAIDLDPGDVENWVQMGAVCFGVRQFQDAARYLREALRREPEHVEANVTLADALLQMSQTPAIQAEAQQALGRALALDPFHPRALYLLGRLYLDRGQIDLAVSTLRRAVRWDPQSREGLLALGQALVRQGETEEGRRILAKAQKAIDTTVDFRGLEFQAYHNPNPNVLARLARVYLQNEMYDSALHAVERGLQAAPADPDLLRLRVEVRQRLDRLAPERER